MTPQEQVKRHFVGGGTLTVLECLRLYHSTECRRIVSRLKHEGLDIRSEAVEGENYKRYRLYSLVDASGKARMAL